MDALSQALISSCAADTRSFACKVVMLATIADGDGFRPHAERLLDIAHHLFSGDLIDQLRRLVEAHPLPSLGDGSSAQGAP